MVQHVSSRDPLSIRSAPPQARTRPAPAQADPQDRVVLGPPPADSEAGAGSPLGTWQGLALLGLGALTLAGCAGIPGFVGGVAVQPQAPISRTLETREAPVAVEAPDKAGFSAPGVIHDVFTKPFPRPSNWKEHTIDLGATSYRTIAPPSGWTVGKAGQGFQITKKADPNVYLQVQDVESANGLGDLEAVMGARKEALREQGMDLREVDALSSGKDFFISVNEFQRGGETWRAELMVNSDLGDGTTTYSATVTTIVYKAGQDATVFPTVLQNTAKTIHTSGALPQVTK